MPQFNYQRGSVSVDNNTVAINGSPATAIKLWYNERKSTMIFVILSFVVLMIMGIYQLGYFVRKMIYTAFLTIMIIWAIHFFRKFDILKGGDSTIAIKSIREIKYRELEHMSGSKMTIIYTKGIGKDKEIKERVVWLTIPLFGKKDRLSPAIEAFEEAGVRITEESD